MAKKKDRGLVKGNLERISSKVFDIYHDEITQLVGRQHGVYALYKKNRLYYVGLAKNLRGRVKHHLKDRHAHKWDSFSLYLVRNVNYLRELESLLVHIAEPRGNIARGRFARSENLLDALKKMMSDSDRRRRDEILVATKRRRPVKSKRRRGVRGKRQGAARKQRKPVLSGLFQPGTELRGKYKGADYTAITDEEGKIHLRGKVFNSPSMAAIDIAGHPKDGWLFWRYKNEKGEWVLLDELRKKRTEQGLAK
jgi:hypothetical protein